MNILDSFLEFLCKQEKLIRLRDNITVYRVQGRYIYFTLEELYDYFYKNIHIMKKPTKIKNIDFKELETICEKYIDEVSKGNKSYGLYNIKEYIFETTLESIYGKDVFNYINNKIK